MCDPITIGAVSLLALSTAMDTYAGFQQADAQAEYQSELVEQQNDLILANAQAANTAFKLDTETAQMNLRLQQEATSEDVQQAQLDRIEAQGTAVASAGGGGLSLQALLGDFYAQEGRNVNIARRNLDTQRTQFQLAVEGAQNTAESRVNSVQGYIAAPVSYPSVVGAVLDFGSGSLGAYTDHRQRQATINTTT